MRYSESLQLFDQACEFPAEHATVVQQLGDIELAAQNGDSVEMSEVLARTGTARASADGAARTLAGESRRRLYLPAIFEEPCHHHAGDEVRTGQPSVAAVSSVRVPDLDQRGVEVTLKPPQSRVADILDGPVGEVGVDGPDAGADE